MSLLLTIFSLLPFYALGAIPTGRLVSRMHGVDIARQGSGNVGATNVARVLGAKPGLVTLIGDIAKGAVAVWLSTLVGSTAEYSAAAAFAVVAGHCFSFPPLAGGKGVATALGALLALTPPVALSVALIFCGVVWCWKIVSLGSLVASVSAPIAAALLGEPAPMLWAIVAMALLIVFRHRSNLERLVRGAEPAFSKKIKSEADGISPTTEG